jgi:Cu(I)-responsive transcriptional regulator
MNIGEAATRSGLTTKTIRYYEDIGLLPPPLRADNGYRDYGARELNRLAFISRARGLGFSIADCRELLGLYSDHNRHSADVKRIALARIDKIDTRIREMMALRATLDRLVRNCHGDDRPDCPILDDLAEFEEAFGREVASPRRSVARR